jgi:hydroxypyruvate reductase
MEPDRFMTYSLRDPRIARILAAALQAVEPGSLTRSCLNDLDLPPHRRCFLLGFGKASEAMTQAAADALEDVEAALVVTKRALRPDAGLREEPERPGGGGVSSIPVTVIEAGHPVPDERSLVAGRAALDFVSQLNKDDLLVCLISGGGSALMTMPVAGLSLADLQALTDAALASGADIEEINVLRRQLDGLKGGGLASATDANVVGLILSDVVGDRLEAIASGPTTPDITSPDDAIAILRKHNIRPPAAVEAALRTTEPAVALAARDRVQNMIIGNRRTAVEAAKRQAESEGFRVEVLQTDLQGQAADVGAALASALRSNSRSRTRPFCAIAAGETTVTLDVRGVGGRNQELALAAVDPLDGLRDCLLVSLATDGEDGPTDAAGAVVTGNSRRRASEMGMQARDSLRRHDSNHFFQALHDLVKLGPTGTNVNDLMLLAGL